jgi:hypothetical protein
LHFEVDREGFFASSSSKYLPNVRITPKSKIHAQNLDRHYCQREKDFALRLAKDFGVRSASVGGLPELFSYYCTGRPNLLNQGLAFSRRRSHDEH